MRERLMEFLACPGCRGGDLTLEPFLREDQDIREGRILCASCGAAYPVISSVPRLLPASLLDTVREYHGDFFHRYRDWFPPSRAVPEDNLLCQQELKRRTLRSFSYQWNTFSTMFEEYGRHRQDFFPRCLPADFFAGRVGLDAGCGFGRHLYGCAREGAEMVGMDLSEAVEAAHRNTGKTGRAHIVQGDIYRLPFRKGVFDFVYSIGVLHHLPEPQDGFSALADLLNPGQHIFLWCYDNEKPGKNRAYERVRRFTTRMNHPLLKTACFFGTAGIRLFLNFPSEFLKRLRLFPERKLPYDYYLGYPFRALQADLFDVFSVPKNQLLRKGGA